jgi:hypothetical protein
VKRLLTFSNLRLVFELILVIAIAIAALSHFYPTQAATRQEPEAPTAVYWYQCNTPNHVAVFIDRVHIYCPSTTPVTGGQPALTGIFYFAFPTAPDSAAASRFLSVLQSSAIAGRTVWVELDPSDTSGASFGCGSGNCRRIIGLEMR